MSPLSTTGFEPAEAELVVTYITKHAKAPASYQVLSLPEFCRILRTENQGQTQMLADFRAFSTTFAERQRLQQFTEAVAPRMALGILRGPAAKVAEEVPEGSNAAVPPTLVILSIEYEDDTDVNRATANREQLQHQLLALPLLGPSIVLMYKELVKCLLQVVVVVGPQECMAQFAATLDRYLYDTCPELCERLRWTDSYVRPDHRVGYDPLAWFRSRPATGYTLFSVELMQAKLAA